MAQWEPIETAPKDGRAVYAENEETGQKGWVVLNRQGEWERIGEDGFGSLGVGFYPNFWWNFGPTASPPALSTSEG